jgi:phosphoribosylformimino-5-aminoimidazole carboxamide ribotide isomerase
VLILPAIDVRGGRCVRLRQGDYAQETVFASDPSAQAKQWVAQGASYLHIVDLDGAREGRPVNGESVRRIVAAAGVPCQLGGGLRTEAHVAEALEWGVERVVVGTRALKDADWFNSVCRRFPGKLVLAVDVKEGRVATDGWLEVSEWSALALARQFQDSPLAALIHTDISRDGMLQGPNFEALAELADNVSFPLIASGGITTLDHIRRLAGLSLAGCIVGRALYERKLDLKEAIKVASSQ